MSEASEPGRGRLQYVITGCAGSGTGWAYAVMRGLGSRCGHQRAYTTTGPSGRVNFAGDSSWCAVPYVDHSTPTVFIQRDPLNIIRSLEQFTPVFTPGSGDPALNYVLKHRPDIADEPDRLSRIIAFVATWGEEVEDRSNVKMLRLENASVATIVAAYAHLTGTSIDARRVRGVLDRVGTNFNSHGGSRSWLTWDDVLRHPLGRRVLKRAERWGYR